MKSTFNGAAILIAFIMIALPLFSQEDVDSKTRPGRQTSDHSATTQPPKPGEIASLSNLTGTYGDVILDGDSSFPATGVLLKANATRPWVVARLGGSPDGFAIFSSSNAELFRIGGDGNVGIGTAAPAARLHIFGSTTPMRISTPNSGGFDVFFRDLLADYGYGSGVLMDMKGNSRLHVGALQLGHLGASAINSTGAGLYLNKHQPYDVIIGDPSHTTTGLQVQSKGTSIFSGNLVVQNQAHVGFDVTGINPLMNLRVGGPNGYLPTLLFSDESNAQIGSVRGYKTQGLIVQAGLNQYIGFRTNATYPDKMRVTADGKVGIGTVSPAYTLDVAGTANVSGTLTGTNATFSGTVTGGNIQANFQDVAEWVPATETLSAGTVVILDQSRSNHVVQSSRPYDTSVAGVVSAQPGIILGEAGDSKAMIATTGRVRVRVDATRHPIAIGDLLVTSSKPGMAMKSVPVELQGVAFHRPGTVVGKALEPLERGEGEILVLLSLQ